jgi:hypothetical protein
MQFQAANLREFVAEFQRQLCGHHGTETGKLSYSREIGAKPVSTRVLILAQFLFKSRPPRRNPFREIWRGFFYLGWMLGLGGG